MTGKTFAQEYIILLHFAVTVLLQIEGKTLHQRKDYNSLYFDTHFIQRSKPNLQYLQGVPV